MAGHDNGGYSGSKEDLLVDGTSLGFAYEHGFDCD